MNVKIFKKNYITMKIKKFNENRNQRETFSLEDTKENEYLLRGEDTDEFRFIQEEFERHDTEKGYSKMRIIIQRVSDGKFFECERTDWGAGEREYEFDCTEVYPQVITITKYV
jgi:hypothetical protein